MVTVSSHLPNEDEEVCSKDAAHAPKSILPTTEELKAHAYDTNNIEAALEALHQDGFVVLKSIVDVDHVDTLNKAMGKEADDLVKNNTKPFNQGVNCTYTLLSSLAVISG